LGEIGIAGRRFQFNFFNRLRFIGKMAIIYLNNPGLYENPKKENGRRRNRKGGATKVSFSL
jgi:hypothetical protein